MSISGSVIYGMTHITLGFKFCHQGFNQHHMFINGCVWVLVHVGLLFFARFSCCSCVVLPVLFNCWFCEHCLPSACGFWPFVVLTEFLLSCPFM